MAAVFVARLRACAQYLARTWLRFLANNIEVETGLQVPAARRRCPIYGPVHLAAVDGYKCDCGYPVPETEPRFI